MILEIPEAEQQLILAVLDRPPPPSQLQRSTDDQLELWEKVKAFQMLRQELKAYFLQLHCLSSPIQEDANTSEFSGSGSQGILVKQFIFC